jgi:hypothetical protein
MQRSPLHDRFVSGDTWPEGLLRAHLYFLARGCIRIPDNINGQLLLFIYFPRFLLFQKELLSKYGK